MVTDAKKRVVFISSFPPRKCGIATFTSDLLAAVSPGVDVGLIAYGHRRKGDCTDIETLAAFGTPSATIAKQVNRLTPLGKTPITDALQKGADLLVGRDGTSTLVLVSDGVETCKGDPCALAWIPMPAF